MKPFGWILIGGCLLFIAVLLFPQREVLVPAMDITVRYEGGDPVANGEVSRSWNHYLGDGWTSSVVRTDQNGKASFREVSKRVPLAIKAFWSQAGIFLHYYPGLAGSIKARDTGNHFIWQRIDFNDRNCCPGEVTIGLQEKEAEDIYFTFGDVVPNE